MAAAATRADVAVFSELAAIDRLAQIHVERLLPGRIGQAQFGVLGRLIAEGPQSPSQLAAALALTKPTMTHALNRLAAAGLIAVEGEPADKRRKRIAPTRAGEAAYAAGAQALAPMLQALRASFPAEAFEAALPFLTRLRSWLAANP
jgi:DNA-binding MarR family transcriptional regulator